MKIAYLLGALSCLSSSILWGFLFPIISHTLKYMDALSLSTLRYLFTAIALMILLISIEGFSIFKLSFKQIILLWLLGLLGFPATSLTTSLAQDMLGSEGALNVSLIMATSPILSLIIIAIIKREMPSYVTLILVVASLFGLMLVITKGNALAFFDISNHPFANFLIIWATINFILYTLGSRWFPSFSALKYSALTMTFGFFSVVIFDIVLMQFSAWQMPKIEVIMSVMPYLLYISIIGTALAFILWNYGNRIITPINGILFFNITPIASVFLSMFFDIYPNIIQVIGIIVTIIALILNNLNQRKNESSIVKKNDID